MKENKKERKNILPFGKIRSRETFRCTQGRYHKTTKAFSNVHSVKNFYLNKTDVIITVNTSHLIHRGLRFSPRGLGSSFKKHRPTVRDENGLRDDPAASDLFSLLP